MKLSIAPRPLSTFVARATERFGDLSKEWFAELRKTLDAATRKAK